MSNEAELTVSVKNSFPVTTISEQEAVVYPRISQAKLAWEDIKEGTKKWRIWLMLAYQDIRLRYRRSVLGPFWITISMAVTVYSMGFLYGHLFHTDLKQYYPFLVAGMLAWGLVSTVIIELTDGFLASEGLIKQIKLPYSLYIHRIATRNIITFFHNILVMLPIYVIFHDDAQINLHTLMLIPGLFVIYINSIIYGLILAILCTRYRDVSQIIKSLIQVIFFMTPVMWNPSILPESKRFFVNLNPFYSILELVRAPLLGTTPSLLNLYVTLLVTFVGLILCAKLFVNYRARIIYWL